MGIQALPTTTVRVLGACQVLNDPSTVIKELLDNALDAKATSISIEISSNTLDTIQVRDNGHGIPPEDRQLVARPHCTSKISSEDDLKDIGGTTLGFRGEALASVAEMSGSLTISTRVEGEQVATALKVNQQSEVFYQDPASLPVGTTVKIGDFIKANPVRRQVALKNTEKCLKKIKQTLLSYAFVRPHVRISLRVLKAKNDKGNWTYAPKPGGNAEDAAYKIVGAGCASQCTWSAVEDEGFMLQAFLPRMDADVSKISNIGSFLSVDARPVSPSRGTPKQIVKIFREAIKKANSNFDGVKDPFLYLEIACPSASYDANIEPAKDDVLFENPDIVVQAAKRLFDAVYHMNQSADQDNTETAPSAAMGATVDALREHDDFFTCLEPLGGERAGLRSPEKGVFPVSSSSALASMADANNEYLETQGNETGSTRVFRSNMYGCDEEDLDLFDARPPTGRTEADFEELRQAKNDITVSNPWIMAKLNTSRRQPAVTEPDLGCQHENPDTHGLRELSPSGRVRPQIDLEATTLPTPRPSSPSPPQEVFHPSDHVPDFLMAGDGHVIGSQSLPPPPPSYEPDRNGHMEAEYHRERPAYDYTLSSQAIGMPTSTPVQAIPDSGAKSRRSPRKQQHQTQINKPFVHPLKDQAQRERVWFDHLPPSHAGLRPNKRRPQDSSGLVTQGELGDLFEDPSPLTPPRRNRDMRDFVTSVDLTGDDSIASMIESRNYPKQKRMSSTRDDSRPVEDEENVAPQRGILSGRGLVPATELAALEAHVGPFKANTARPSKRRKTSESRALRQLSVNSAAPDAADDEEYRPGTGYRTKSGRRRTIDGSSSKVRRTKSAKLPLERIPAGRATTHVIVNTATAIDTISRMAGKIDEEKSLLSWEESPLGAYDAFTIPQTLDEINYLNVQLSKLLRGMVPNGEMVQDLGLLMRDAFAAHERNHLDVRVGGDV